MALRSINPSWPHRSVWSVADNQKVGSVVGVTYFRFSNDAVTQLAGQFAVSQAAANRHWQILAGSVLIAGMLLAVGLR